MKNGFVLYVVCAIVVVCFVAVVVCFMWCRQPYHSLSFWTSSKMGRLLVGGATSPMNEEWF